MQLKSSETISSNERIGVFWRIRDISYKYELCENKFFLRI